MSERTAPAPAGPLALPAPAIEGQRRFPRSLGFGCPLPPPALSPRAVREAAPVIGPGWALNPGLWLQEDLSVPGPVAERLGHRTCRGQPPLLWVESPRTGFVTSFELRGPFDEAVRALLAGAPADGIEGRTARWLARAEIILPPGAVEAGQEEWQRTLAVATAELASQRYTVLRGLVSPVLLAALRAHFRRLERESMFDLHPGTLKCSPRKGRHNDPACNLIHNELAPLVSRLTGAAVKPSYCLLAVYPLGAFLGRHRDRAQCAWNVSMPLDYRPEPAPGTEWPLYVEVGQQARPLHLGIGDAVVYSGTELYHWRPMQPDGLRSTVCFFHFVPRDFDGSLD
jgi:hypothetical protein